MRGQISVEFLMITAISLTIIGASAFVLLDYTRSASDQTGLQQVADIGYRVVSEAQNVYVYGDQSFVTVETSLPEGIRDIYVVDNSTLVFELATSRGAVTVPVFSDVPLSGMREVIPRDFINAADMPFSQGRATIRVTAVNGVLGMRVEVHRIA